jgi:hypothetical protein
MIKSRILRWVQYVARMRVVINAYFGEKFKEREGTEGTGMDSR